MDTHKFFVENIRFHLHEKDKLVFVGWFFDGSVHGHSLSVLLDGEELKVEVQINEGAEVRQKYLGSVNVIEAEVVGTVTLPRNWKSCRKLLIYSGNGQDRRKAYGISVARLRRLESEISYYIESCHREEGSIKVSGWCMGSGEIKLTLCHGAETLPAQKTEHYGRRDLFSIFPECSREVRPGFLVQAEAPGNGRGGFCLKMRSGEHAVRVRLKRWDEKTAWQLLTEKAEDTVRYLKRNGFAATLCKINSKLRKKEESTYGNWRKKYAVTEEELKRQRQEDTEDGPMFSILVPLYRTKPEYLRELIDSVTAQTYGKWELCMAAVEETENGKAAGSGSCSLTRILEEYVQRDARIRYCTLKENGGISKNTNAALAMAQGDYLVLTDHDDVLSPDALYEFAAAIRREPLTDVLYSDEDKISMDGKKYFEPHFKPDFNPDLLCSINYICHLFSVKKELQQRVGGLRAEYDGAQDMDFILRCTEQAKHICHVPKILYHWRCHMDSTAANPESKRYAFEAGRRAVEAHYERLGIPAKVENARFYGMYRTKYQWSEEPLVSVIIPNKDHAGDLAKCVGSIYGQSDYRNFELIIVENNSTEKETFDYYKRLEAEHENAHVVHYEGGFNFSKINNFGAASAKGDYFLLLNNDTEMIGSGCIRELLGYCMREDVGAVGAKLLYEDGTIQHAGVVIGFGGTAGHAFIGKSRYDAGYFGRILCAQDYSAVTAACLMTKRSVYEAVGGLTEELAVAFNDVDFCLKIREAGKLVVYDPYAELFHYESKSRGYEDSPDKVERFQGEAETLLSRWRSMIERGDPYYNPNLTLDGSDFSLRR